MSTSRAAAAAIRIYVPSYNNSAAVAASVASCRDAPAHIVISDNGSDEAHLSVLRTLETRCELIIQPRSLGRVGNWEFCLEHFLQSDAAWMKWLFAGDRLQPGAIPVLERAGERYPPARLIIAEHDIIEGPNKRHRWRKLPGTQLIEPVEALRLAAERGNWFGAPVGHCVHREAVADGFDFGTLPWIADMQYCVNIARRFPVLYLAEAVGEFHVAARQHFSAHGLRHRSALEEAIVRLQAAQAYRDATGDQAEHERLVEEIERFVEGAALLRVLAVSPRSPELIADFARSLSFGQLARVLTGETVRRLRARFGREGRGV